MVKQTSFSIKLFDKISYAAYIYTCIILIAMKFLLQLHLHNITGLEEAGCLELPKLHQIALMKYVQMSKMAAKFLET